MGLIQNETDLRKIMERHLEEVIEIVSEKVLSKLKVQIKKDVFTSPNDWYQRTGEFEESWKWKDVQKTVTGLVREMSYDPSDMKWNPSKWQHGNPKQSAVDNLADILNLAFNGYAAGFTSDMMFGKRHFSHYRRPYWENFIKSLFDEGELEKMFNDELSKRGFTRI